jgi:hypothetical protein
LSNSSIELSKKSNYDEYNLEEKQNQNILKMFECSIYSYLETSGGQSSNQYLNVVHFFNASVI